ncbi:hypothetical protein GCM10011309_23170 [Litorimonas cladophorae]|uniref:Uncharacterized protein n=1 Tax=Litorimonas cladophorae TaxID=1220491 RepID=A0A918KT09_9PROT|nr:hypothetical protein [Litorimonas cladophorae]GGX72241.1 hypothetical protein GCM10011309_23170 [Litorimonas cladophorae]
MKYAIVSSIVTVSFLFGQTSLANDVELRGETFCFPAKDVPKLVRKLSEVKADRRDIVDVQLAPRFIIKDEGVWPERFYLAENGVEVTPLPFSQETGAVPTFLDATSARPESDICIDDPTRADRPRDDEGLYFEMGLSPFFKTSTGAHSLAELEKGAKDGKKFYKTMLPSWAALLMPDADYFAIRMLDPNLKPMAFALTGQGEMALDIKVVKDMWIVSLDDIQALQASKLIVRGGAYNLQPVPSPKNLVRFGWGDATDEK